MTATGSRWCLVSLDMRTLTDDADKVNEVKIKALDENLFQEKLQMMEEKLTQSLDCFMKVAMALRTDQKK